MLYASSRSAILSVAQELGVRVDTKIETGEVDELTLTFLKREIHGVEVDDKKKTFARPRGPMKRNQNQKVEIQEIAASTDDQNVKVEIPDTAESND